VVDRQPEPGRRHPEARLRGRHPQVTRHGELHAGAEHEPVEGGQRHERRVPQQPQRPVEGGDEHVVVDPAEVGPGAEVPAGPGEHDHPPAGLPRRQQLVAQRGDGGEVDGVAALGPVDGEDGDAPGVGRFDHGGTT
jgi:hypothetical protein